MSKYEFSQKLPNQISCAHRIVTPYYCHPAYPTISHTRPHQVWLRSNVRCSLQSMLDPPIHTKYYDTTHPFAED